MYQVSRFANGLTLATATMPHMASVCAGIWVSVGGRYEPAELSGVSHFIEHLLFKGTKRRSPRKISEDIEGLGGYLNAFTAEENTCIFARAHQQHLPEVIDVLTDMFLHSQLAPADIVKEREVIKEELASYVDQPQQLVLELLNETLWPNQPLGRPLIGTKKTLNAFRREHFVKFLGSHYVAPNTLVVLSGNVTHAQARQAVAKFATQIKPGARTEFTPAVNLQRAPVLHLHTRKTEQTQLALGIRTCSRHDDRRFALRLLNTLLGENMSSRLFQIVREDRGLAYSIYSSLSFFADTGDITIAAGLDADNLAPTLRLIARELRTLTERAPSAAELGRARDYAIGQFDLGLESTENQMNWLGETLLSYGKIVPPADTKAALAAVTPAQIRAVARDFFRPEHLNLALVSPLKNLNGLGRYLEFKGL